MPTDLQKAKDFIFRAAPIEMTSKDIIKSLGLNCKDGTLDRRFREASSGKDREGNRIIPELLKRYDYNNKGRKIVYFRANPEYLIRKVEQRRLKDIHVLGYWTAKILGVFTNA